MTPSVYQRRPLDVIWLVFVRAAERQARHLPVRRFLTPDVTNVHSFMR